MKKPPEVTDEELAAALLQMERDGKISIDVDGTVHLLTPEIEGAKQMTNNKDSAVLAPCPWCQKTPKHGDSIYG
jgi:hypothetical protein